MTGGAMKFHTLLSAVLVAAHTLPAQAEAIRWSIGVVEQTVEVQGSSPALVFPPVKLPAPVKPAAFPTKATPLANADKAAKSPRTSANPTTALTGKSGGAPSDTFRKAL